MTHRGSRARIAANDDIHRVFAVSQVRLDKSGHVADVWWSEVDSKTNADVGAPTIVTVAEVVTAIHSGHQVVARFPTDHAHAPDRRFVLQGHPEGHETIRLESPAGQGGGMPRLH